jgi:hypothetical protein
MNMQLNPGEGDPDEYTLDTRRGQKLATHRFAGELVALIYIALIAEIASVTGEFYILFPELAALSHDVFTRPRGAWASSPWLLVISPVLTGAIGITFTRMWPYGYSSVLLTVAGAVAVLLLLRSPVTPAISAGLLPLTLGVKSWWYPPGILLGTLLLAAIAIPWKKLSNSGNWQELTTSTEVADESIGRLERGWLWLVALMAFVVFAIFCVEFSGHRAVRRLFGNSHDLRFILFPPLVVIGFEMFGHIRACPWARKPLLLPAACFMSAAGGVLAWTVLGYGAVAAAVSMAWGIAVLRLFQLHIPPALAVALLPQVMTSPTVGYAFSVGLGTLLMTGWFSLYRWLSIKLNRHPLRCAIFDFIP